MNDWIEVNIPYSEFSKTEFNKPGTLIETDSKILMIGHINENSGVCDCCSTNTDKHFVKRYKIVWRADERG
jgi:hypothetical protein